MQSPFALFRKHQRVLMVILTGLAMFSFMVMEQLRADSPLTLPILAGVVGMALFGYFGWRRGETMTWGVAGVAIGIAAAVVMMRLSPGGPKPPVQTAMGDISREDLNQLIARRNHANEFLRMAFEKVSPLKSDNPMLVNLYEQRLRGAMFGFGYGRQDDVSDDVIMGFLLDKEADDLGISISDAAISDYINKVTDKKLTQKQYTALLQSMRLSEGQLYDAIRGELRAKLALEALIPRAAPTPEQYWDDYRKLQMTESLEVAAVPVDDFLAEAPKPTDEQLRTYFNAWKNIPSAAPGAPGLQQPRRARIEYLEADFTDIEKQVAAKPVTDAEVLKYYEDHKQDYRNRPAAGSSTIDPLQLPGALQGPPLTVPEAPVFPAPDFPQSPATKSLPATPSTDKAPATKTPETKAPTTKAPAAPTSKPAAPAAPNKTGKDAGKSGAFNDGPARRLGQDGEMLALADERFDRLPQVVDQLASAEKTSANKSAAKTSTPPPASPSADKKPAAATAPATPAASPAKPATGAAGQAPREPAAPPMPRTGAAAKGGAAAKNEPLPEFRPLDDLLQREIRDIILRTRTLEVMKTRIQAAYDYMDKLREQVLPAEIGAPPRMNAEQRSKALAEYAAKNQLKYGITPLMSAQELFDASDKYPIASAAEPIDDPFQKREPIGVLREVFGSLAESLFQPAQADDRDAHRFSFWKVEDVAEHTPSLDDPGIRELATRGWQIQDFAQKRAETRAKELADLVRKSSPKPMAEALTGQTVTNKPKGAALVVVPTAPFSWYTVQSSAPRDLMPDTTPKLSEVNGVKGADNAFMKAVFDDMKVGEVKAVPNFGPTAYYVVKVKTRHPADAEELATFRARFMKENFFGNMFYRSTYDYLNGPSQQGLINAWATQLFAKYNVHRNVEEEDQARSGRSRRRRTG